jgi:hypothetical protein
VSHGSECVNLISVPSTQSLNTTAVALHLMVYVRLSLSLMLRPTVSRPVCLGIKRPSGAYDQIFITCVTVAGVLTWGALSDERMGL